MGKRRIIVKQSAAQNIAAISLFIESKGMVATAEKFTDDIYDYFISLTDNLHSHRFCRDPKRSAAGYKCITYKRKYTIVFLETETKLLICEFIPSKLIHW
ncbi:MAG: hypothetical protein J0H55_10335 [Chitinophagaceae bacterium]|nr:hypothetical protein [Chitinophagaceae bacterium]